MASFQPPVDSPLEMAPELATACALQVEEPTMARAL